MAINYNEEDLRNHVGVAAVIKNDKGEILMQEHIKYGFWTIPVGKAKFNQSPEDALKQEVLEETNLEIIEFKEMTCRDYFYERNNKRVKVESHLFEILKYQNEMKNLETEKHKQQIFLSLEKIMDLPYLSDLTLCYLEFIGLKREAYKN